MKKQPDNLSNINLKLLDAIDRADKEAIKQLIKDGADPNHVNTKKSTPLRLAVESGNLELVQTLIELGADLNDWNALKLACEREDLAILNYLLDKVSFSYLNAQDYKTGNNLLHYVLHKCSFAVVKALIEHGIDPYKKNKKGQTPLEYAQKKSAQIDDVTIEYLKNVKKDFRSNHLYMAITKYLKHQKRNEDFIREMEKTEGFCNGISMLFLLSRHIGEQERTNPSAEKDDYEWFCQTRRDFLEIDEIISSENQEEKEKKFQNFDRFISLMKMYQNPYEFFSGPHQSDAHLITEILFSDSKKSSKIDEEFVFAGKFTAQECSYILNIAIPINKMCLISSGKHAISVYRNKDGYHCYDSRRPEETYRLLDNVAEVTSFIFNSNVYRPNDFCPLGFVTFGSEPTATYPSYQNMLDQLADNDLRFQQTSSAIYDTVLGMVVRFNSIELLEAVIEKYGNKLDFIEGYGRAMQRKRYELLKKLIQINKFPGGESPVLTAIVNNLAEPMDFLLKNGYDIKLRDTNMRTYLHVAIDKKEFECAQVLIDNKADINAKEITGKTALIEAAINSNIKGIRFLIEHGADTTLSDYSGHTALDYVLKVKNAEGIQLLRDAREFSSEKDSEDSSESSQTKSVSDNEEQKEDAQELKTISYPEIEPLRQHALELEKNSKNALSSSKAKAINKFVKDYNTKITAQEKLILVEEYLKNPDKKNQLLVNTGKNLHKIKNIFFFRKHFNNVDLHHHLSNSTTEDLLLELRHTLNSEISGKNIIK